MLMGLCATSCWKANAHDGTQADSVCIVDSDSVRIADSVRMADSIRIADSIRVADSTYHITLLFAGDLMQHSQQIQMGRKADGTYDYSLCFKYMKEEIERADVAIANFETTLGARPTPAIRSSARPTSSLSTVAMLVSTSCSPPTTMCATAIRRALSAPSP